MEPKDYIGQLVLFNKADYLGMVTEGPISEARGPNFMGPSYRVVWLWSERMDHREDSIIDLDRIKNMIETHANFKKTIEHSNDHT